MPPALSTLGPRSVVTVTVVRTTVHGRTISGVTERGGHAAERSHERGSGTSRAERKERTRQALLDVTLRLIASRSLASISLREVARDAGIVPTAFYRHFDSIDALGIELVDESMRPLRQMIRNARRGVAAHGDIIKSTVAILGDQVREHPAQFRFLVRERYGGVGAVRRAIDTELRLFTSDLAVDLARLTAGFDWTADDLEMAADLMVSAMLGVIMDLLEMDQRRSEDETAILQRAEHQLRLIALGMGSWRSKP
jgi:TetR/AcrR family transcriptional regulator, fatty acid biosynthesis regulator